VGRTVVSLIGICALAVLLNAFPARVGVILSLTDPSSFVPLLAPEFQVHMPWVNRYLVLAFMLGAANLVSGRWNIVTRSAELGLDLFGLFIVAQLVLGGPISPYPWVTGLIKIGLVLAFLLTAIGAVRKLVRLLKASILEPSRA
jgi:hypothetical protein